MAYALSRADLGSISDVEAAFSTVRLLPAEEDIPPEFKQGNLYTKVVEALFYGNELPQCEMVFLPGFDDDEAPADLNRCVRAHLKSYSPQQQHKVAGIGLMIAACCELRPLAATAEPAVGS